MGLVLASFIFSLWLQDCIFFGKYVESGHPDARPPPTRRELRDEWRLENRKSFANIWSDMTYGITLFVLMYFNQSKVSSFRLISLPMLLLGTGAAISRGFGRCPAPLFFLPARAAMA